MVDKELVEEFGDSWDGLWNYAGKYGRSEAVFNSWRFGISRNNAYAELYCENPYED